MIVSLIPDRQRKSEVISIVQAGMYCKTILIMIEIDSRCYGKYNEKWTF